MADNITIKIEQVQIGNIVVEPTFQREVRRKKVAKIMAEFDKCLFGVPKVKYEDGKYIAVDGQNRLTAASLMNDTARLKGEVAPFDMIACEVVYNATDRQLAKQYAVQDDIKTQISVNDKHRALLEAEDADAILIETLTKSEGFTISNKSSKGFYVITCIGTIKNILVELGSNDYTRMLRLLGKVWKGSPESLSATMLKGMSVFLKMYGDCIINSFFVNNLKKSHPQQIENSTKLNMDVSANYRVAKTIYVLYNKRLHDDVKLPYRF